MQLAHGYHFNADFEEIEYVRESKKEYEGEEL